MELSDEISYIDFPCHLIKTNIISDNPMICHILYDAHTWKRYIEDCSHAGDWYNI